MRKYIVNWTEFHSATVDADSEEEAKALADFVPDTCIHEFDVEIEECVEGGVGDDSD